MDAMEVLQRRIEDEGQPVTFKWLSYENKISMDNAKRWVLLLVTVASLSFCLGRVGLRW